eukprot:gnl/TRDRNA2_/TRDRNA2_127695_c0_seq2.p1 gnl/TRDRNA2_/TRDRNA2_127695_c0~~gnl/TRDRNA2_/TRDRNA2_127695_c0_seq2.p1  ORF type:complete len:208 (-),score=9.35 gnl/TRDRNA2_/TRDRNA2_127695_c0_seq2:119-742(-)
MLFTQFSVASFAIINVADTFSDSTESTPRRLGLTEYYMQFSVNWMKNGWPYERCQPKLGLGCEGGFKAWCCDTDWNCVDQARAWYECHPKYFGPNLSNVCCPDEYSSLPSVVDDEDEDEDAPETPEHPLERMMREEFEPFRSLEKSNSTHISELAGLTNTRASQDGHLRSLDLATFLVPTMVIVLAVVRYTSSPARRRIASATPLLQ